MLKRAKVREAEAVTKDGLPKSSYAYTPSDEPADWKLPFLDASGAPDPAHLPGAVASLSPGGFRGMKADIPAAATSAVKAKLRKAYRTWKGADAAYPDTISEARYEIDGYELREAVVLLDQGSTSAQVLVAPNGDTIVFPNWTGAFDGLGKPRPGTAEPDDAAVQAAADQSDAWDASDAADALKALVRLKGRETGETDQQAMLDAAIAGTLDFLKAETGEIGSPPDADDACATCGDPMGCPCTTCSCVLHNDTIVEARAFLADPVRHKLTGRVRLALREAGARHSKVDQGRINDAHDLLHDAGAQHDPDTTYKGMPAKDYGDGNTGVEEGRRPATVEVRIEATSPREAVKFRESAGSADSTPATLRESRPLFDDATRTVTVTPIKPGWGNGRDNIYYPASALQAAVAEGKFDHLKMFMDHPTAVAERSQPERSVKDWFATTQTASWDSVRNEPRVDIRVFEQAVYDRFKSAPEQIAFSVLGGAIARPGSVGGKNGRIAESIQHLRSLDWVTEAGAGGGIAFAESAWNEEEDDMALKDITDLTEAQLREANPGLWAKLTGKPVEVAAPATPAAEVVPAWAQAIIEGQQKIEAREAVAAAERSTADLREAAKRIVIETVGKSTLIKPAKDQIIARFAEAATGNGQRFADETALREAIATDIRETEGLIKAATGGRSSVTGLGGVVGDAPAGATLRESMLGGLIARGGGDRVPSKPKLVWTAEEVAGTVPVKAAEMGAGASA